LLSTKSKWVAGLVAGTLVTSGVLYAATADSDTQGTVIRVIDGDTVDMKIAGAEQRVRLLNVDTPETVDPNKGVECLGPEASDHLKSILSPGDKVDLEYDVERTDRYGRTLAGVFKDGHLVNAEIAALGLGIAVKFEPNIKFYDEVLAAQNKASENSAGLFSTDIKCTVPAQVDEVASALEEVPEELSDSIEESGSQAAEAAAAVAMGLGLKKTLDGITPDRSPVTHALLASTFAGLRSQLSDSISTAEDLEKAHRAQESKLKKEEKERKEAERKQKEEKLKAEKAKQGAAELKKAQEQQKAATAERRRAAAPSKQNKTQQQTQPRKKAQRPTAPRTPKKTYQAPRKKSSGSSNYTGPRCYAPGGKTWRPC